MVYVIHQHDVIIIGGGLTGLQAAISLADSGINCAIISKVHPLRSHSVAAQGGMNASLGNVHGEDGTEDSWESHAFDTVKGSDYLADQDAYSIRWKKANVLSPTSSTVSVHNFLWSTKTSIWSWLIGSF